MSLISDILYIRSNLKLKKAVDLIQYDNEEALRILESIGASTNPPYGKEITSAAVFFYKGVVLHALHRDAEAKYNLRLVQLIPTWYIVFGKSTIEDIKNSAKEYLEEMFEDM